MNSPIWVILIVVWGIGALFVVAAFGVGWWLIRQLGTKSRKEGQCRPRQQE